MRQMLPLLPSDIDRMLQRIAKLNRIVATGNATQATMAAADLRTLPSYRTIPTSYRGQETWRSSAKMKPQRA
jgi:hypothetical protein